MRYCIEYASGRCQSFANGRQDLLEWLKLLKDEVITDIRMVYKSGVSDSVIDKYRKYIKNKPADGSRTGPEKYMETSIFGGGV